MMYPVVPLCACRFLLMMIPNSEFASFLIRSILKLLFDSDGNEEGRFSAKLIGSGGADGSSGFGSSGLGSSSSTTIGIFCFLGGFLIVSGFFEVTDDSSPLLMDPRGDPELGDPSETSDPSELFGVVSESYPDSSDLVDGLNC